MSPTTPSFELAKRPQSARQGYRFSRTVSIALVALLLCSSLAFAQKRAGRTGGAGNGPGSNPWTGSGPGVAGPPGSGPVPSSSGGVVGLAIDGSTVSASLELLGGVQADLSIEFEQVVGLTAQNLGLSVDLISVGDTSILSRLPGVGVIPAAFPLRLTVTPPSGGALSFSGPYEVHLHTENLEYTAGTLLRLYKAEGGGDFVDITDRVGRGSYRVRGTSGGFSEFLIAVETRSSSVVIEEKYSQLRSYLLTNSGTMPVVVSLALLTLLDDSEYLGYDINDFKLASSVLAEFVEAVELYSSSGDIPNVWRAPGDLENVAGNLAALARTTRFSLLVAP